MNKVLVRLENISKKYNDKYVIKNLSLDVYEGEFLTLLGSSGCGKTTILRMISGLEHVTEGKIYIDDVDVTEVDPTKREVNTIFQNFALFPHMNTWDNISFGLRMKKIPSEEIEKRVKKVIKLVKLEGFEDRLPSQLSGGQQQRVAIARGIVMNPKVLLLDESLCSLDLKLKRKMQLELKKIQKQSGITFIYVTHDQDEALTMSDRIVIIEKGQIEQNDTPQNIYRNPKTVFAADFIGESNIIPSIIKEVLEDSIKVITNEDKIPFIFSKYESDKKNDKINLLIRPENIKLSKNELKNSIKGVVKDVVYDGSVTKLFIDTEGDLNLKVNTNGNIDIKEEEEIYLKLDEEFVVPIRGKQNEK
ncbi:MAG: ABC transporter ATP-binding protein [Bacilli bacterium]|nr:ABC transporter ATP-binding protein [Bacilli bacterium]